MITKEEALNAIAVKHGHKDWELARYRLGERHLHVLLHEAMDYYYTELSNSHKPVVMQTLPLDFVKWYSGMEEQKILKAYERWKKESGIVSVASEGREKHVRGGCIDRTRKKDGACCYPVGTCDDCQAP